MPALQRTAISLILIVETFMKSFRQWCLALGACRLVPAHQTGFAIKPGLLGTLLATSISVLAAAPASAQEAAQSFNIPAQSLSAALQSFSRQSGGQLLFPDTLVEGKTSQPVSGSYTPHAALERLLAGTNIQILASGNKVYTLRAASADNPGLTTLSAVTVVGSRSDTPAAYAGGQIASGSRVGLLGNKDVMDTPFSTTSFTSEYIENQQATSVAEVLRHDPSVRSVFPQGGLGEHTYVRGFWTQSHELAWNGLFGLVPHNRTSTELLDRVEVLKGPGALLSGMSLSGSVGGVVNLVPKRATSEPITRFTTTLKSHNNLGGHIDFGRRFGEDDKFGIRVNGVKADGNLDVHGQRENRSLGAIALDYKGERLRASLDLYDINEKQRGGAPFLTSFAPGEMPTPPNPKINTLPNAYSNSSSQAIIGSAEFDITDNWTAFVMGGTKRQKGSGFLNNAFGQRAKENGDYTALGMNIKNYFDVNALEMGTRGEFSTGSIGHHVVLSANMITQESGAAAASKAWASNLYDPAPPLEVDEPEVYKTGKTTLSSVALADTLSAFDDRLLLTAGMRFQRVQQKGFNASGAVTDRYDEHALTPAIALVVKPWDAPVSLYANYIEGLSQGGSVTDASADNFGEVFSPYKTKQYEVGLKWDNDTVLNTLSFFQIAKPSMTKNEATNTYKPDGEQRNRGIEWTIAGELNPGLRILGGVVYTDAVATKTNGGLLNGKQALGVPRWNSSLGLEWDTIWNRNLTLSASALHSSSQWLDAANTQKIPSWTRLDLGLRYTTKIASNKVTFRANVINATDKRYWSSVWNGSTSIGAPRSYRLSMQIDF